MQFQGSRQSWLERQRCLPSYGQYDPFRVPANIAQSLKHFKCTQFGNDDYGTDGCPCCRQLEKLPLSFGCPLSHIETVSNSACSYFHFVLNMVALSVLVFLVNGIYNLVQLVDTCNTNSEYCIYVYGVPFRRFSTYFDGAHEIMDLVTILLLFAFNLWTTYHFQRLYYFERYKVKASDYTILLTGVDHERVTSEDIMAYFRREGAAEIEILYTHQIKTYLKAERRKLGLKSKLQHQRHKISMQEVDKLEEEIRSCEQLMLPTINKFYFNQEKSIRTDKVFVSFESAEVKHAIWKKFKMAEWKTILLNVFSRGGNININGCSIGFEPIIEPNEIVWENLQVSSRSRYLLILAGNILTIFILCVSFGLIMWLSYLQLQAASDDQHWYLSYVCAIIISLINLIMSYALEMMSNKEGRFSLTGKFTSLMTKETTTFFFNTALIPFSMFFVFKSRDDDEGLILTVLSIFFLSAFVNPLLLLLNIQSTLKYFRRRRLLNSNHDAMMTPQSQANEIFERPSFEIEFKYSVVSKLIMMTIFFAGIFPLGSLFAVCGLVLSYFVNKYMLLRHSQLFKVSYRIGRRANRINSLLPGIYGLGIITNEYLVQQSVDTLNIVLFATSLVLSAIAFTYGGYLVKCFANRWRSRKQSIVGNLTRHEAIHSAGIIDYKHLNPTSCQEKRHRDLSAPILELHSPPPMFETPQPGLHRADTSAPPQGQHLQLPKPQHSRQNPFIRSMLLYANAFPDERN